MARYLCLLFISIFPLGSRGHSQTIQISGVVPVRGEVDMKKLMVGEVALVQSKSPLKIEQVKRGPASIVKVTAP